MNLNKTIRRWYYATEHQQFLKKKLLNAHHRIVWGLLFPDFRGIKEPKTKKQKRIHENKNNESKVSGGFHTP